MRIAVLSDIHGNLTALEAVLEAIGDDAEQVWCLGDIIGYGPDPNACVERVREGGFITVVGNHDHACLGHLDLADFNPDARRACEWTSERLSRENRLFLEGLPDTLVQEERFTLVHGSPRAPVWEYVASPEVALENLAFFETPICLVGHTHVPLAFHLTVEDEDERSRCERRWLQDGQRLDLSKGRWILNPGGVGQPRDGDPRAAFLLLDTAAGTAEVRRVPYEVEAVQKRMRRAGLPQSLVTRLAFGW